MTVAKENDRPPVFGFARIGRWHYFVYPRSIRPTRRLVQFAVSTITVPCHVLFTVCLHGGTLFDPVDLPGEPSAKCNPFDFPARIEVLVIPGQNLSGIATLAHCPHEVIVNLNGHLRFAATPGAVAHGNVAFKLAHLKSHPLLARPRISSASPSVDLAENENLKIPLGKRLRRIMALPIGSLM